MQLLQRFTSGLTFDNSLASYRLRLASSEEDLVAAQRLRFEVFNLELHEGLSQSFENGLDSDRFDAVCTHLLVEHLPSGKVVGTYRMQTGLNALVHHGYYCSSEFDMSPYEALRGEVLELGRACIHADHRSYTVLSQLWRGIVQFASRTGSRYLVGCSSLTSQDPAEGLQAWHTLRAHAAPEHLQTIPLSHCACEAHQVRHGDYRLPKLLSAYLALGAWVCGPPALDPDFKTIDFLTLMDLNSPAMGQRRRRFGIG